MEDIITVLDGRAELADEIAASEPALREYFALRLADWFGNPEFTEAFAGHLLPDAGSQARKPMLLERIGQIIDCG